MENDKKLVAVFYDNKGECENVAKVMNVNENEYKKLISSQAKNNSEKEIEKKEIKNKLNKHENKIDFLMTKNVFLAKATYDRFVDRGFINENKDFDKDFYDYVFNGVELNLENAPEDFKIIYKKVVE